MGKSTKNSAILLISCPDKKGIVTEVTQFIFHHGGNITDLEQHVDTNASKFFMRVEWSLDEFNLDHNTFSKKFSETIASKFQLSWQIFYNNHKPRMAVFVSKQGHCLLDIISRYQNKEWDVEIPIIISNHKDWKDTAEKHGFRFAFLPITNENKKAAEEEQRQLLKNENIDFIVLARYMQILSKEFIDAYPDKIINIHHSFLPAFPGAKPYHSAFERGVKIIGATSHYVTKELDAGPIIEQDISYVSHNDSVEDLVRKGRDVEKIVLSRAIWKHINRKVIVHQNKTIVFE